MFNEIKNYIKKGYISFHTPAHKGRSKSINSILNSEFDLTELEETDNLYNPNGIIKELENKLANHFNCEKAFILVNGATSGIMAVFGMFRENDKVLIDRSCHVSVVNAIIASGICPIFIKPKINEFNIACPPSKEDIENNLKENPDIKAVFITSPNYYGLCANIDEISEITKKEDIILIVDEAHGAHRYFLEDGNIIKADISIFSFHKNLPALTQTGALVVNSDELDLYKLKQSLRLYTSTSPSYLLLLSIDRMLKFMQNKGKEKLKRINNEAFKLREKLLKKNINVLQNDDPTRIVLNVKNTDEFLNSLKQKYKIIPEMADGENVVFIISLHNKISELKKLYKGIINLYMGKQLDSLEFDLPKKVLNPKEAYLKNKKTVSIDEAVNKVCGECIISFPPSVPIILYGELIDKNVIDVLKKKQEKIIIIDGI